MRCNRLSGVRHLPLRASSGRRSADRGHPGNKDVELHTGDARIDAGRAEDYHSVDASVWAGDIQAEPFHVFKDGLFRSFDWSGKGPYRLHAHLKAGDLRLYSKGAERQ